MREELKEELLENQQAKMEEFKKSLNYSRRSWRRIAS